ncbi:MAG: O-antigen ligase family protein [Deltaproteobacteria bacterium]|nr:O-antigen ligase family protein [Deltaproteobacteria bacterium]
MRRVGCLLLLSTCFLYAVFAQRFAEIHLQLSFLDFPIFVGEFLLIGSLLLLAAIFWKEGTKPSGPFWVLLGIYIVWILMKALIGYHDYGPLAFRSAALFYYPLFAVLAFHFWHRSDFSSFVTVFLLMGLAVIPHFVEWYGYFYCPLVMIWIILAFHFPVKKLRFVLMAIAPFIFDFGVFLDVSYSRSHIIGVFISILFLLLFLTWMLIRSVKPFLKTAGVVLLGVAVLFGAFFVRQKISHFFSLQAMRGVNEGEVRQLLHEVSPQFQLQDIPVRLYIPESPIPSEKSENVMVTEKEKGGTAVSKTGFLSATPDGSVNSVLLRLYIWRDLMREVIDTRSWLGQSFGKPQRSRTVEMLGWSFGDWWGLGWMPPHNSFIHAIYRAGIVGVLLIAVFLLSILMLARDFVRMQSVAGLLFLTILVYWICIANFLSFLEVPYTAVPFWVLYGVVWKYRMSLTLS